MIFRFVRLWVALLLVYVAVALADDNKDKPIARQLPPIETFLLEPVTMENVSFWVPAEKTGPVINRSCRPRENCSFSCVLPATVCHTKSESCPGEVARLLAEYAARYHEQSLPLTIFNGWQWEYSYSLCQFESVTYDLPQRGGCWESSWEAILTESTGSACLQWLQISPSDKAADKRDENAEGSRIEVKTFNSMRIRNGYPKERQLQS
jgi:hypothetical protein